MRVNTNQNQSRYRQSSPPVSQFEQTYRSICASLEQRSEIVGTLLDRVQRPQGYLQPAGKNKIIVHCNQYSHISGTLNKILSSSAQQNPLQRQQKFWAENEKLQRHLEEQLRKLKAVDTHIDNIVNQQFDKCNEIDEVQETIRVILSKKDHDHIRKAEPYYQIKQKCVDFLANKKREKEQAKAEKLTLVKSILGLLHHLKQHRGNGLAENMKNSMRDKKDHDAEMMLIERVTNDIREIKKNKSELVGLESQSKQLISFVVDLEKKIAALAKQLSTLLEKQNQACMELENICKLKAETNFFEKTFFSMFGLSDVFKQTRTMEDYNHELDTICLRAEEYLKEDLDQDKQINKIKQGIQTTDRTIGIFEHIFQKIETENKRRNQLLEQIQKIQEWHHSQDQAREKITESETQLQKLMLKKNRLSKTLGNKIDEADVNAYKNVHSELEQLNYLIIDREKKVGQMRAAVGENAKNLYDWTLAIQQDYSDILSQVVPSVWFRDNDFSREETIKDLNIYLLKTFKRLSIAD